MQKIKQFVKPILPGWIINQRRLWLFKTLIKEINDLNIEKVDIQEGFPSVSLRDGKTFHGLSTDPERLKIYQLIKGKINCNIINEVNFGVVYEIISRYLAPRSLPGELLRNPSKYDPLRDPINDFALPLSKKMELANIFMPRVGDVIIDVGACHGYGSMRLAEYVGEQGKVVLIEANPISAKIIRKNIEANNINNIVLVETALSDYDSDYGSFYIDGVTTGNSLRSDVLDNLGITDLDKIQVPISSGDRLLADLKILKINYLNITVNGGEPEVLDGLSSVINNSDRLCVTMPGWYYRDGERLDRLLSEKLDTLGLTKVISGKLGRVIGWK